MKKIIVTLLAVTAVFTAKTAHAQTTSDLGTWSSVQLVKSFGAPYAMARLEHRSYDHVQATECWFAMAGGGYNFNSWLKGDLSYEYWQIPAAGGITQHKAVLCLTYRAPESRWTPYLMYEFFNSFDTGKWVRSLHYAGTEISLGKGHGLDFFYMFHLYDKGGLTAACHTLGIGYTFVF